MGGRRDPRSVPYHLRETDPDLYNFLLDILHSESDGVPGGVTTTTPSTINAGDTGDIGTESLGWSPGDHEHAVATESATGLANANAEGSSTSLARADHAHKRDVRVAKAGSDVGTRNRLNFADSSQITITVSDDSGNDEIDISATVVANSIGNTELRQGGACSVIGRSANSTGNVADISAASNGHYLQRNGNVVLFQAIQAADVPSAGGWTDTGPSVELTTPGDLVAIGASALGAGKLEIDATASSGLTALYAKMLANSASGGATLFDGTAIPPSAAQAGFRTGIYFSLGGFTPATVSLAGSVEAAWEINQTNDTTDRDSALVFQTCLNASAAEKMRLTSTGVLRPVADNTQDIGSASLRWGDAYLGQAIVGEPDPTSATLLNVSSEASADQVIFELALTAATPFVERYSRARGTLGSLSASSAADGIVDYRYYGYRSGAYSEGARLIVDVEGVTNQLAGRFTWQTRPDLAMGGVLTTRLAVTAAGNVVVGNQASALGTTVTDGFLYIPSCAGTPTGVPTTYTGSIPLIYDSTNFILYAYAGGSWRAH